MTRGEWEEDNGGKRKGRVKSRNMYKRLKDKANCSGGGLNVGGLVDRAGESSRRWGGNGDKYN